MKSEGRGFKREHLSKDMGICSMTCVYGYVEKGTTMSRALLGGKRLEKSADTGHENIVRHPQHRLWTESSRAEATE